MPFNISKRSAASISITSTACGLSKQAADRICDGETTPIVVFISVGTILSRSVSIIAVSYELPGKNTSQLSQRKGEHFDRKKENKEKQKEFKKLVTRAN